MLGGRRPGRAAIRAPRTIDLRDWKRREHFETFSSWHYSHFNICADVDVSDFRPAMREAGISYNTAVVYLLARTANDIVEFRLRARDGIVVEHEVVHPATTVMASDDLFTFAFFEYDRDLRRFSAHVHEATERVRRSPSLEDPPGRDDLLFMTAIPWVSFTSFAHPIPVVPMDSIPRFAWGKVREDGDRLLMPLSVQGHHGLMDGLHAGRFFEQAQRYLDAPGSLVDTG
jgi:chloramphenicol O-acetyltransferase type A